MLLTTNLKSYKKERILLKNQFKKKKNYGNLATNQQIEEVFEPNSDQILEAII